MAPYIIGGSTKIGKVDVVDLLRQVLRRGAMSKDRRRTMTIERMKVEFAYCAAQLVMCHDIPSDASGTILDWLATASPAEVLGVFSA